MSNGRNSIGCVGWGVFIILGLLAFSFIASFFGDGSGGSPQNPNQGYMTLQDDKLMTTIQMKKDYGESVTKSEQEFLDAAKAGKFGKPYESRPDGSQDGAGR